MSTNHLLDKWETGQTTLNGWIMLPGALQAEIMAQYEWDSITIDMQHGMIDYAQAVDILIALKATGVVPLVRVPWLEPGIIMKMLDAGIKGIICPMIDTAEQAQQLVKTVKYPPLGERSYGPLRAMMLEGDNYVKNSNKSNLAFAMIETKKALDNLDEIMKVEGLDGIYIGPSDLAFAMGYPPHFDTTEKVLIDKTLDILAKAKSHGLIAGIHTIAPQYAKKMMARGFDLVTTGSDIGALTSGTIKNVDIFRGDKPSVENFKISPNRDY